MRLRELLSFLSRESHQREENSSSIFLKREQDYGEASQLQKAQVKSLSTWASGGIS